MEANIDMERMSCFRDLMDAKRENLYNVKKLKTGIKELDNFLHGGIPYEAMTVIAAHEGSGKSTLVSQIMCHAVDKAEENVFLYSGEMSDTLILNTFTHQVAGKHTVKDRFGRAIIEDSVADMITNTYKGRIFPYSMKNNISNKLNRFQEDMIYAHTNLGCNVFVIDNLMSAGDDLIGASVNENDRQAMIAGFLSEFAKKYKVAVILVAHTRKQGNFQIENLNDLISGSSVTKNRSSLILFYSSLDKSEQLPGMENERRIQITKNRLYGRLSYDGIKVHYDVNCKRIYGDIDKDSYLNDFSCFPKVSPEEEYGITNKELKELKSLY